MTIELGEDELLGAHLLARMDGVESRDGTGFERVLRSSLSHGLADRLAAAGLAWPPTGGAVDLADRVSGELVADGSGAGGRGSTGGAVTAAGPGVADTAWVLRAPAGLGRNVALCAVLVFAVAVLLVGGYALRWSWTGSTANNQVWDWMQLLLLPVALATFPLWLRFSEFMSPVRRRMLGAAVIVFALFVLIGYLNPLAWTGFRGQTLWSWLTLIILPVSIVTVRVWPRAAVMCTGVMSPPQQ